ncbi:alpha/beta fold hydrolase [Neobacillus niacini]|uniref:alpha/beta fold hydrolase n=1 Tax=Neobacillus niacini TaxID=86668 RepID=UPI0021CB6877|nr:alpha/beta fold hydrolase [Neobacillus niacini]MCM3767715.1 alpha/beta fold hydrolase [Neobacillus niacini]
MKSKIFKALGISIVVVLLLSMMTGFSKRDSTYDMRPIVFVHGFFGSANQFESQAMRFSSNGYPDNYLAAFEYDSSTASVTPAESRFTRLDALINQLLKETGADKIDLMGHSLGTTEMTNYLNSSPERAKKVAHYVNIDGVAGKALPGGVPTLAIWAELGTPGRTFVGAENVTLAGQSHVQAATSPEAFAHIFKFFTGKEPKTTQIVAEPRGQVRLSGKALIFPQNTAPEKATLEIYKVNGKTGEREKKKPEAVFTIAADGSWGPFKAKGGDNYEFVIIRDGVANHHLFFEEFIRSDHFVRLLTSPPEGGVTASMDTSDHHTNLSINRSKEFFGDQGANNDILKINGTNIVNAENSAANLRTINYFVYDEGADKVNHLNVPTKAFAGLPFLKGVDMYIPGATPPNSTVTVELQSRGSNGKKQVINLPNWASSKLRSVTVQFKDYVQ